MTPGRRGSDAPRDSGGRQVAWPRLRRRQEKEVRELPAQIELAIAAAEDKKAVDIVVLDLRKRLASPTSS